MDLGRVPPSLPLLLTVLSLMCSKRALDIFFFFYLVHVYRWCDLRIRYLLLSFKFRNSVLLPEVGFVSNFLLLWITMDLSRELIPPGICWIPRAVFSGA